MPDGQQPEPVIVARDIRVCAECGKSYRYRGRHKYCTLACCLRHHDRTRLRADVPLVCQRCAAVYTWRMYHGRKYCSSVCCEASRVDRPRVSRTDRRVAVPHD